MSAEQLITKHLDTWTSAHKTRSSAGRGSSSKLDLYGIKKLRELILELAVRGKLVSQDPNDEPIIEVLNRTQEFDTKVIITSKLQNQKIDDVDSNFLLPPGWACISMGSIGTTSIGLTYSPSEVSNVGTPVLRSSNIQNNKIDLDDLVRVGKEIKQNLMVNQGDLLICARNGSKALVGKTAMIKQLDEPMTFGAFMAIYRSPFNDYIEVFLNSPVFRRFLDNVSTTTINQITQNNIKSTIVPLPPISEQNRIVAKVDELMAFCDQLEQAQTVNIAAHAQLVEALLTTLTNSKDHQELQANWQRIAEHFDTLFTTEDSIDQLKQTILQLAVMGKLVPQDPNDEPASELLKKIAAEKAQLIKEGKIKKEKPLPAITDDEKPFELPDCWEWVYLNEVFALVTDGDHQAPPKSDEGIPFLVIGNLNTRFISFDGCRYVPLEYFEKLDWGKKPTFNDVLYTVTGSYGIPIKVKSSVEFCVQRHVAIFKSLNITPVNYILNILEAKFAFEYATRIATGIAQKTVPLTGLRKMPIPLAPINEQSRIVSKVNELMLICNTLKTNLQNAQSTQLTLADALVEKAVC